MSFDQTADPGGAAQAMPVNMYQTTHAVVIVAVAPAVTSVTAAKRRSRT